MAKDQDTNKPCLNQGTARRPKNKPLKSIIVTARMVGQLKIDLENIAEYECRSLSQQICYFCIKSVGNYKQANPGFKPPTVRE